MEKSMYVDYYAFLFTKEKLGLKSLSQPVYCVSL